MHDSDTTTGRVLLSVSRGRLAEPTAERALPRLTRVWEIGAEDLWLVAASDRRDEGGAELRVTLGGEVPDVRAIRVALAASGRVLGEIDVRYGCTFQPFGLALNEADLRAALAEGLRLSATDAARGVLVLETEAGLDAGLGPHLVSAGGAMNTEDAWRVFDEALASTRTLQPFNWIEGCVMDGLRASGAEEALAEHVEYFFLGGRLDYTGPRGEPRRDEIFGIEALLPFAFLPAGHPGIQIMATYVAAKTGADGLLLDRAEDAEGRPRAFTEITIEGCYTLSYPLAVGCRRDGREAWRELAWAQIEARCEHLVRDGVVAQRARLGGEPEQADWARACGWFLIGVARTAETLGECPPRIVAVFAAVARRAVERQRADGLWSVYLNEPETGSDTSGSAAIAAGLALGARLGLVVEPADRKNAAGAARRALPGFVPHLTGDGLLGGVAQLNRGGEALQRGGFRVMAPFAMGLLASARAAVRAGEEAAR